MRGTVTRGLCLILLLATTVLIYQPGLHGPFLFDDYANLPPLGHQGTIDSAAKAFNFINSGIAGPSGRPLALASFLLDARDWPADPYPFKRTNLIIHLLCGLALLVLCLQLMRTPGLDDGSRPPGWSPAWLALMACGLWLLHPFNVSTTLYVIQRMAQLSALASLAGLAAFVYGRRLSAASPNRGIVWMAAGIGGGTILGVLCKENAVIVPLLALIIERLCFPERSLPTQSRWAVRVLTLLPSLAIAAYMIYLVTLGRIADQYSGRDFTLGERLLTQPRALLEYLYLAVWPLAGSRGLYGDSYPISSSLLSPVATLPSLIGLVSILILCAVLPRRWLALRLALLFFLAAHLLEGSIFPLELYFEHRNYLPITLLPLPLCLAIAQLRNSRLAVALYLGILALTASATVGRVEIWTDQLRLVAHSVRMAPDSTRANLDLANLLEERGKPELAGKIFAQLDTGFPRQAEFLALHLLHRCRQRTLSASDIDQALPRLSREKLDSRISGVMEKLGSYPIEQRCEALTAERAVAILQAILQSPANRSDVRRAQAAVSIAQLQIYRNRPEEAVAGFELALREKQSPDVVLVAMRDLAVTGHYCAAQAFLLRHAKLLKDRGQTLGSDYSAELAHFEGVLAQEVASRRLSCAPFVAPPPAPPP